MTSNRKDDPLSWAGDDDPTLSPGESADAALPEGWSVPRSTAVTPTGSIAPTGSVAPATGQADAAPAAVTLVAMGILAGVYLLYTIGWFIGVARVGNPVPDPVGAFMFSLGAWLAVAAPVIWFGSVYWLTGAHPRLRLLWLLIGVVVLAPLPFILGSGA